MNKEVSFELAELLKRKGFNSPCSGVYYKPDNDKPMLTEFIIDETIGEYYTKAPTLIDAIMWIYEKHNIWINVSIGHDENKIWYNAYIEKVELGYNYDPINKNFDITGDTPIEAYTKAIFYTLKELI